MKSIVACFAVCAVLVSRGATASDVRQPNVGPMAPGGHLYVAIGDRTGYEVLRFPLVDGLPATYPDLVYLNETYPMAAARDGTFYATVPLGCCRLPSQG